MNKKIDKLVSLGSGIYDYNIGCHFKTLEPTAMQINITYKCNSRCKMCNIWKMKPTGEMNLDEWRLTLSDSIFKKIKVLSIAGGEPFLFGRLPEFVDLVLEYMPNLEKVGFITNGFLKNKIVNTVDLISKKLQSLGIELTVGVSLDGIGITHDIIRGTPGSFDKVSQTIKDLKRLQQKRSFYLGVSGVICGTNVRKIEKVEKWCKDLGVPFFYQIVGFHETYVNNLDTRPILDIKEKDKQRFFSIIRRLRNSAKKGDIRSLIKSYYWTDMLSMYEKGTNRKSPCPFLLDAFVLDSLGDVYYCLSERAIGNVRQGKTVSEIYYDPKNIDFRRSLSKKACLKCNSGCMVTSAIAKDFKKWAWFMLTGKIDNLIW